MRGLITLTFLVSSAAIAQSTSSLPGVDFAKYHTYQWVTTRPHPDSDVDAKIKRSIDSQLATKGLSKMENKAVSAGTLGIDMTDPALKQIVWAGKISKAIDLRSSAKTKQKNLDKAVQSLMKLFPPKQH